MNAIELKDYLEPKDIEKLVTQGLGSDAPLYDNEGNPIFQTICHNAPGEGKHKLFYYVETKLFHCYTECGESFDLFDLVIRSGRARGFVEAFQYVLDFFGLGFHSQITSYEREIKTSDWDLINKYENFATKREKQEEKIFSHNMLTFFNPLGAREWEQEGISIEAMGKYNICTDPTSQKVIIPHYNKGGDLIGIRGRSYQASDLASGKKYSPIYIENELYNHPLGSHLYGLNFNKEAIKRAKQVVIFEGEKSVLKAQTFYGNNNFSVGSCGSTISDDQVDLLLNLGVSEIIIAFDKENDNTPASEITNKYRDKLTKLASKFSPYVNTYYVMDTSGILDFKDSPIDKGRNSLELLLKNKILVPSLSIIQHKGKGYGKRN